MVGKQENRLDFFCYTFSMEKFNEPVLFYECELYPCSNFSSFEVVYQGETWKTSEYAYQAAKFEDKKIKKKGLVRHKAYCHGRNTASKTLTAMAIGAGDRKKTDRITSEKSG